MTAFALSQISYAPEVSSRGRRAPQ